MKKALMVVLPMAVFAGYVGYQRLINQEQDIQLVTARVTRGDVVRGIDATGRLEAVTTYEWARKSPALSGGSMRTLTRGSAAEVIARLEPSLFETQVHEPKTSGAETLARVPTVDALLDNASI